MQSSITNNHYLYKTPQHLYQTLLYSEDLCIQFCLPYNIHDYHKIERHPNLTLTHLPVASLRYTGP